MKKISFLPLLALVIAVAASAFTTQRKTNDVWYTFTGTSFNDVDNYLLYESTESDESPGCSTLGNICAVQLPDNGQTPDEGDFNVLKQDIVDAQAGHSSSDSRIQMQE